MSKSIILSLLILLASCGGGGGSSGSPTIPPVTTPVVPIPVTNPLFSKYVGEKEKANISNSDAHDIAYQISIVADLAHLLSYNNDLRFVRFDAAINDYPNSPIDECESGQFILGELIGNQIDVEYIQCVTGPYTIDGKGQFAALSIDMNGDLDSATLHFDDLRIQYENRNFQFEGTIKANFGFVTVDDATYSALITDTTSNQQFYLEDLKIGLGVSTATSDYGMLGKVFLSPYGYVSITTTTDSFKVNNPAQRLTLSIEGENQLVIAQQDNGNIGLGLFANDSNITNTLTAVPYSYIFAQTYLQQTNTAPIAAARFADPQIDKQIALLFDSSTSTDNEFDLLNYQWQVTSKPEGASVNIIDNGFVNAFAQFDVAGDYQLSLTVDDGQLTSSAVIFDLYVRQDKPVVSLSNSAAEHIFSTSFENTVLIDNASDDGPFEISLIYAPSSMQIDTNGEILWDGKIPQLGEDILINYAVKVSNRDHQTSMKQSLLLKDAKQGPAFQIDEFPKRVINQLDFNGDGNLELLLLRNAVLEIVDVANNSLVPIWTATLPTSDIANITFSAALDALFVLQESGQIHQVSTLTKSSTIIATADVTDFGFRSIFEVTTSNAGEVLNVFGARKVLNIQSDTVRSVPNSAEGLADIDGDGVLDYITNDGIYRSDDMSRIVNTGSQLHGMNFLSIVDIDSDENDEIFGVKTVFVDADTTRYDLVLFDLEGDQLVLKQTFTGTTNGFYFAVSTDGKNLFTIEQQTKIASYVLNAQNLYEHVATRPIEGINLESTAVQQGIPYQPCEIKSASSFYALIICGGRIPGQEVYESYYSRLDLPADVLTDDVFYDVSQRFEGFSNSIVNPEGGFSIGQSLGVLLLDEDFNAQKMLINNLDSFKDQDQLFFQHSNDAMDISGWQSVSNKIIKSSLSLGQQFEFDLGLNGSISKFEFFEFEDEGYIIVRSGTKLVIVRRSDLQEISTLFITAEDNSDNELNSIKVFQQNGNDHAVLWVGSKLLFMQRLGETFSIYKEVAIPNSENLPFGSDLLHVLSVDEMAGSNQVQLIRPSSNEDDPFMSFKNFERISYSLDTEIFEFNQTDTRRFSTLFPGKPSYCLANGPNRVRPVAYVITAGINVDSKFVEQDRQRPAKIVALDLASGEMIWSSTGLPADENVAANNLNIACFSGVDSQRLIFSTLQTLSVSH